MDYEINKRLEVPGEVQGGRPVIKGTRLDVETVVSHLLAGDTAADILEAFPFITVEDINACKEFALKMSSLEYSIVEFKKQ
jgi:uncharacterized protein (DUF433 family)